MKTTLTLIFIFICSIVKGQNCDIMYLPDEKSVVATYNNNYNGLGFYVGGYITTSFPQPYVYTTPQSRFNRVGVSLTSGKVSVMGGAFIETYYDNVKFTPDIWVKIYPLRILLDVKEGLDLTLGVNYMNGTKIGLGLAIPF
jgi:hypothetical protein